MKKDHLFTSASGVRHDWLHNDDGGAVVSSQDVGAVLERNKALANENNGWNATRDMRRVATIPMILLQKWQAEEGWDPWDPANGDRLARKLNDPDYAYLRTAPGRVAPLADGGFR